MSRPESPFPDPSAYPVGSLESRAAARLLLNRRRSGIMTIVVAFIRPDGTENVEARLVVTVGAA